MDTVTPTPSPFTNQTFSPHVGTAFAAVLGEHEHVDLKLISAEDTRLNPIDARATGTSGYVRRDPFQLLFVGPNEIVLMQGLYTFRHPSLGEFVMSIVPVGPGENGLLYQAVFN